MFACEAFHVFFENYFPGRNLFFTESRAQHLVRVFEEGSERFSSEHTSCPFKGFFLRIAPGFCFFVLHGILCCCGGRSRGIITEPT